MKRILHTFVTPLKLSSTWIIGFLILVVLTFVLWQAHLVTGWQFLGLLAYLSAMLDIALLMWLLAHITLRSRVSAPLKRF